MATNPLDDDQIADDLIPGILKRSKSYHSGYGKKTYGEIKRLADGHPPDHKARKMKKLINEAKRLSDKPKGFRGRGRKH